MEQVKQWWKYDVTLFSPAITITPGACSITMALAGETLESIVLGTQTVLGTIAFAKLAHYTRSKQYEAYNQNG